MESVPASRDVAVGCGVGTYLCAKLLSIEFIDLAEEALHAVEKLSVSSSLNDFHCFLTILSFPGDTLGPLVGV